jgi:hypothetical protein
MSSFMAGSGGRVLDELTASSNSLSKAANQTSKGWLMSTGTEDDEEEEETQQENSYPVQGWPLWR